MGHVPQRAEAGEGMHSVGLKDWIRRWPTPTVQDAKNDAGPSQWDRNSDPLNVAVKRWPTPTQADGMGDPGNSGRDGGENLRTAVRDWPTPTATMHKGSSPKAMTRISGRSRERDCLDFAAEMGGASGQLNPTFVEWLMGFPKNWTEVD